MLKQVARNTTLGLVGNSAGLLLQFVASVVIARDLGATGFGVYASALAFATLFGTLADGGVSGGWSRELVLADAEQAGALVGAGLLVKLAASLLSYGALVLIALLTGLDSEQLGVALIVGFAYMLAFFGGQTGLIIARARGRMEFDALLTVVYSAIFMAWVLMAPHTPLAIAWGWVASYFCFAVLGLGIVVRVFVQPRWVLNTALMRQLWQVGLPLGLSSLLLLVYTRLPTYILTARSSPEQIGLFNAAYGLPRNLQTAAITLGAALTPVFVRLAAEDEQKLRLAYTLVLRVVIAMLVPIAIGGMFFSPYVIVLLFGNGYAASAPILGYGCISLCCYTISMVAQTLLVAQGRGVRWFLALGVGLVVNAILAVWFVPHIGAVGASYGALGADAVILVLTIVWTRSSINGALFVAAITRITVCAIGMGLIVWATRFWPVWGSMVAAGAGYGALLVLTGAIQRTEITRVLQLIPIGTARTARSRAE